ncbi:hypothetical protein GCM10007881_50010 [Mesorhizobium huakuii]|uniref:hypothetical protein n=1 Tax=Mesorhizobium TaxID=68287 RepID=UPI001F0B36A2|nr:MULTISPECIES: hypothetical protein [Mesorhizobium]MCH4560468.1 hypothetical protein [Mesorhizobium jarvisii]GLQ81480.1 hypothetical protein GCM10007881_50010 [Mesorhizobium huakuii]
MAKDKFTIADLDEELRRRSAKAKASLPKAAPKKDYPNADRFEEGGRRLYSAYDAADVQPQQEPGRKVWIKLRGLAAIVLVIVGAILVAIAIKALP